MSSGSRGFDESENVLEIFNKPANFNRGRRRSSFMQNLGVAVSSVRISIASLGRSKSHGSQARASILSPPRTSSVGGRNSSTQRPPPMTLQEEMDRNNELEAYLKKEKAEFEKLSSEPKLLVLGSSDCGKSTLLKQMKILHGNGFSDAEKGNYRSLIRKGIVTYITTLIDMITEYEYRHIQKQYGDLSEFREDFQRGDDEMTPERLKRLEEAWKDPVVQEKFLTGTHNLPDSAKFYIERMGEIFGEPYTPSNEDILKLRTATVSISDSIFDMDGTKLHIIDVNGFSHSRNSWLTYFENITCVLFVASLSSYDQVMVEEAEVNRMVDSIVLFQDLTNNKTLEKKPFILFLNKKDIYERKIKTSNIVDYFPGYKGAPGDAAQGIKYFDGKFKDPNIVSKPVATHVTCCTDSEFMKVIILTVVQTVLEGRLKEAGFSF